MSRKPSDRDERPRLDASNLPVAVQNLWETMLRLDPNWDMHAWLTDRAHEEMKLVDAHLAKERMRLEQRISRIENLARRIGREFEMTEADPNQLNLFDDFAEKATVEEAAQSEEALEEESWEPHPATAHMEALAGDAGDDPLMAVLAQAILCELDDAAGRGMLPMTLGDLGEALIPRGIDSEELVEALEWLLETNQATEVDEDMFVPGDAA